MALHLDKRGDQVQITVDVVKAAVGNENSGKEMIAFLFTRRGQELMSSNTEEVSITVATCSQARVLDQLL